MSGNRLVVGLILLLAGCATVPTEAPPDRGAAFGLTGAPR